MSEPIEPVQAGAKDRAHIDRDWVFARSLIEGVRVREVRNVVTANGIITELYRPDWGIVPGAVQQVIYVGLRRVSPEPRAADAARGATVGVARRAEPVHRRVVLRQHVRPPL